MNKQNTVITHNGFFHIDELFAIVLLSKFIIEEKVIDLKIIRTRDEELLSCYKNDENIYVIDVGEEFNCDRKNFDHHQDDPKLIWTKKFVKDLDLENGKNILLSSCGLIWQECKKEKYKIKEKYGQKLIDQLNIITQKVDLCDNGIKPWTLTRIFSNYNCYDSSDEDKRFKEALIEVEKYISNIITSGKESKKDVFELLLEHLEKFIENEKIYGELEKELRLKISKNSPSLVEYGTTFRKKDINILYDSFLNIFKNTKKIAELSIKGKIEIKKSLEDAIKKGREEIIILREEEYAAKSELCNMSEKALLVVKSRNDNEWEIKSVNKYQDDPYTGRILMPKEWAGKRKEDLENISGFKGMFFCHKLRFITIFHGKEEDCLKVCNKIIEISKENNL